MKPLFYPWFTFYIFLLGILFVNTSNDNVSLEAKTNNYSLKELKANFVKIWKNPQKYVEFHLDDKNFPQASGFYELTPSYRKVNILDEEHDFEIEWCHFEQKWQLIKVNPLGKLPNFAMEQEPILEGEQFSRPTKAGIKNCVTYEHIKEVIKKLGKTNQELKVEKKEFETVKETSQKQIENLKKQNEILKQQIENYQKQEEDNNSFLEKHKKLLETHEQLIKDNEKLKSDVQTKTNETSNLEKQLAGLKYKTSMFDDMDKKCNDLEQSLSPMRTNLKSKNAEIKKLQTIVEKQSDLCNERQQRIYYLENEFQKAQESKNKQLNNIKAAYKDFSKIQKTENLKKQNENTQIEVTDSGQETHQSIEKVIHNINEVAQKNKQQNELTKYQHSKIKELTNAVQELEGVLMQRDEEIQTQATILEQNDQELEEQETMINELRHELELRTVGLNKLWKRLKEETKIDLPNETALPIKYISWPQNSSEHQCGDTKNLAGFESVSDYEPEIGDLILSIDAELMKNKRQVVVNEMLIINNIKNDRKLEVIPGPGWNDEEGIRCLDLYKIKRLEIGGIYAI